jgi:hypothetical protein
MSRSLARTALVSAVGVLAAGALTTAATTAADAAVATSPPTIKVFVTKHHDVRMTTHMRPGVHRFAVRSGDSAAFQVVQVRRGYTKAELSRDVNAGLNADQPKLKALKRFERNVTLLGGVPSAPGDRGVLFLNLPRGTYWVADTNAHVQRASKILTVHIGGARLSATMPKASGTVRAIHEATWAPRPKTLPASGMLRFTNASQDNHFVELAKLAPGKTVADFKAWIDKVSKGENAGPPPINQRAKTLDSGVVSPGHSMTMRYSLSHGHYVLLCWWPDAEMGGMPHAFMGMFRGITLK